MHRFLVSLWITTQVCVLGVDLSCREGTDKENCVEWFALWTLLLVWLSMLYVIIVSAVVVLVLTWKIQKEWLFPTVSKAEPNASPAQV